MNISVLEFVQSNLELIVLLFPAGFVLWEAGFLHLTGSRRHWRRFGIGLYISGFSLALGSCLILKNKTSDETIATFIVLLALGGFLPFIALLVRENEFGNLVHPLGSTATRIAGVFIYLFSIYLVFDMEK